MQDDPPSYLNSSNYHQGAVMRLQASTDGGQLFAGFASGVIHQWSVQSNGVLQLLQTLRGHSSRILSLVLTADGNTLYSSSADLSCRRWRDLLSSIGAGASQSLLNTSPQPVTCLALRSASNALCAGCENNFIFQWLLENDSTSQPQHPQKTSGHSAQVNDLAVVASAAGGAALLFSCSSDRTIRKWRLDWGVEVKLFVVTLTP